MKTTFYARSPIGAGDQDDWVVTTQHVTEDPTFATHVRIGEHVQIGGELFIVDRKIWLPKARSVSIMMSKVDPDA